jgi:hypothetical protein
MYMGDRKWILLVVSVVELFIVSILEPFIVSKVNNEKNYEKKHKKGKKHKKRNLSTPALVRGSLPSALSFRTKRRTSPRPNKGMVKGEGSS